MLFDIYWQCVPNGNLHVGVAIGYFVYLYIYLHTLNVAQERRASKVLRGENELVI